MKPVIGFQKLLGLTVHYSKSNWENPIGWEIRVRVQHLDTQSSLWLIAEERNVNAIRVVVDWEAETVTASIHQRGDGVTPVAGTRPLTWGLRPVMMESPEHFRSFIEAVIVPAYDGVHRST